MRTNEIRSEIDEIKRLEEKIKQKYLKYETKLYIFSFQQYENIRSFGDSIYTREANKVEAEEGQSHLLKNIVECNDKSIPRSKEGKDKKRDTYESAYALYESRELTLNAFKSGICQIKATQGQGLIILTPKDMPQILPLVQVKAGNTSENVLNEIRQIIYSLYRAKDITKKVYNNMTIRSNTKMDTVCLDSKNNKTSDLHRLLLNLTDYISLKRSDKYVALSNLSIYYT